MAEAIDYILAITVVIAELLSCSNVAAAQRNIAFVGDSINDTLEHAPTDEDLAAEVRANIAIESATSC